MHSIGTSLIGSMAWDDESTWDDVDIIHMYSHSPADIFAGIESEINTSKTGPLHYTSVELKKLVDLLKSGDVKMYLAVVSPSVLSSTPWLLSLKGVLLRSPTLAIVQGLKVYMEVMLQMGRETDNEEIRMHRFRNAYRFAKFGTHYYTKCGIDFPVVPQVTEEEVVAAIEEFNAAVETRRTGDPADKIKYIETMPEQALERWLIKTRYDLFRLEEDIITK